MNYLDLIKNELNRELEILKKNLESANKCRQDAPKSTESRSDTTRAYYENLINVLAEKISVLERQISQVPKNPIVGSFLWQLVEKENKKFVIVPNGFGGRKCEDLTLVSINAPFVKNLLH